MEAGCGYNYMPLSFLVPSFFPSSHVLSFMVGGGTVVNGMFFDRGSKADYDLWEQLGNNGWGWNGLEPYFKKSDTYHPPDPATGIEHDASTHRTDGPVQVAYPNFIYP